MAINFMQAAEGAAGSVKEGMELAQAAQTYEANQAKVQQMKDEVENNKFNRVMGLVDRIMKEPSPTARKNMSKALNATSQRLGLGQISEMGLDQFVNDEELRGKYLETMRNNPDIIKTLGGNPQTREQTLGAMFDAYGPKESWNMFMDQVKTQQQSSKEQRMLQQGEQEIALKKEELDVKRAAVAQKGAKSAADLTIGEKKRDTEFAKTWQEFSDAGGYAKIEENLKTLDDTIASIEGGETSKVAGALPEFARQFTRTGEIETGVAGVLYQGLKETFGSQLSDGERKAMISSTYNPKQSPEENIKRIKSLKSRILEAAKAKQSAGDFFEENGTLAGYKGKTRISIGDKQVSLDPSKQKPNTKGFESSINNAIKDPAFEKLSNESKKIFFKEMLNRFGMTEKDYDIDKTLETFYGKKEK